MSRVSGRSDIVDISCEIRVRRPKAILIYDGAIECWLPLSLVEIDEDGGTVAMPEWLAQREGLV